MFKNMIFIAATWLILVYAVGILLIYIQSTFQIHNKYFEFIFMYHKPSSGTGRSSFLNSNTPFEIILFFLVGFLYVKYYYNPRAKKL